MVGPSIELDSVLLAVLEKGREVPSKLATRTSIPRGDVLYGSVPAGEIGGRSGKREGRLLLLHTLLESFCSLSTTLTSLDPPDVRHLILAHGVQLKGPLSFLAQ